MSDDKSEELALEHAWKWFEYHANQRMTMIRFYVTVGGAIAAGVGYLWTTHENLISAVLSLFWVLASYCFLRLDVPGSRLVKRGEDAMACIQDSISNKLDAPHFLICKLADDKRDGSGKRNFHYPYSYSENFEALFFACFTIFLSMFLLNAYALIHPAPAPAPVTRVEMVHQ